MKVVAYASGIPNPEKSPHKLEVLQRFINGVNTLGDQGILHYGKNTISSDIGVIQGWVHDGSPRSPHLMLRKSVAENLLNKHTIIVDSNLFNYNLGKLHPSHYSRYSMDGVFPTTGNYFSDFVDPKRWEKISRDLQISLKNNRNDGYHILICCQRNGGWSMGGLDVMDWCNKTIKRIRKFSNRPIVVRAHPGDSKAKHYLKIRQAGARVSTNKHILDDFKNCWAVITYNSSPGVAAAIEGLPVFVTDPNPDISQARAVANTNLKNIESPKFFDRQEWVEKLAMSHWNFDEVSSGDAWRHIRNYV